jgi:hypothetical protein
MGISVAESTCIIFLKAETYIKLRVNPYFRRGIVFNNYPLTDIKFAPID